MREFVESAKRLFTTGVVTQAKLDAWLTAKILTQAEYSYIIEKVV